MTISFVAIFSTQYSLQTTANEVAPPLICSCLSDFLNENPTLQYAHPQKFW